jgi:hypothetical protein
MNVKKDVAIVQLIKEVKTLFQLRIYFNVKYPFCFFKIGIRCTFLVWSMNRADGIESDFQVSD